MDDIIYINLHFNDEGGDRDRLNAVKENIKIGNAIFNKNAAHAVKYKFPNGNLPLEEEIRKTNFKVKAMYAQFERAPW